MSMGMIVIIYQLYVNNSVNPPGEDMLFEDGEIMLFEDNVDMAYE